MVIFGDGYYWFTDIIANCDKWRLEVVTRFQSHWHSWQTRNWGVELGSLRGLGGVKNTLILWGHAIIGMQRVFVCFCYVLQMIPKSNWILMKTHSLAIIMSISSCNAPRLVETSASFGAFWSTLYFPIERSCPRSSLAGSRYRDSTTPKCLNHGDFSKKKICNVVNPQYMGQSFPLTFIFLRGVETTNQVCMQPTS